ncbi:MAG: hypothetical protein P1V51_24340 [Deltaproteobacteria bacterium]|nr:hypothetical protein [Deltaproteobacteria bacterium]
MRPYDDLRRHVPAAAANRIGKRSRVVLLSLRQVRLALEERGTVLLTAVCEALPMVAPLLRATRSSDAVLALCPAGALAEPRDRHHFFSEVVRQAEATRCNRPLILTAPPLKLRGFEEADLVAEQIYEWVEAGFTHVPLDVSGVDLARAPAIVERAAAPLLENELGLELLVEPGQEDEVGELTAGLKLLGIEVDLVGVLGGGAVGMAVAASEVDPIAVSWWEGEEDEDFRSGLRNAVGAGARMVALRSPFTRELIEGLPPELREGEAPLELLREILEDEDDPRLDEAARDRLEIGLLAETEDLLRLLRLRGAAGELLDHILADDA